MVTKIIEFIKTARPRQWVKNLTLYAGLIFTGNFLSPIVWWKDFWTVTQAVGVFTVVASGIYFFNDLLDIEADRNHPFKKRRPIASGKISRFQALAVFCLCSLFGLYWASQLSQLFALVTAGYWLMQIFYSILLKNIEVVDVFIIAMGFFLRVFAGAIVMNAHLSIWFLLCVISVSLFLAVGKRRGEMAMLGPTAAAAHRKVMSKYTPSLLDTYLSMFATTSFLSWALFAFNFYEQAGDSAPTSLVLISRTLTINKWLMATIPVVIFGIMRYLQVVYDGARAETPEKVILTDVPLILSVGIWAAIVVGVLYLGPL